MPWLWVGGIASTRHNGVGGAGWVFTFLICTLGEPSLSVLVSPCFVYFDYERAF